MGMIGGIGAVRRRTGNREQETMSSRRSEHEETQETVVVMEKLWYEDLEPGYAAEGWSELKVWQLQLEGF